MSITFNEVIENNLLSSQALKIIPKKCRCGHDLEFNDSLTHLICTNENCLYKVLNRVNKFCKKTDLKISENDLIHIIQKLNIITPYQLLMIGDVIKAGHITESDISNLNEFTSSLDKIKQKDWYLYELVELCSIDNISNIAYRIFDGFNSVEEAYKEIETDQITFIGERLGTKSSEGNIISVNVYNDLMNIKDELLFGETQLNIRTYNKRLRISFADNVKPFVNKIEFIDKINGYKIYKFVLVAGVNEDTNILVKNTSLSTNKYILAKIINDNFISQEVNDGNIAVSDIGNEVVTGLVPKHHKIYIDTTENIIGKLNIMRYGNGNKV